MVFPENTLPFPKRFILDHTCGSCPVDQQLIDKRIIYGDQHHISQTLMKVDVNVKLIELLYDYYQRELKIFPPY